MKNEYYQEVKTYYDQDAGDFDTRYWANPVLQKIRQSFREEVKMHSFENVLEIGYGTGLDLAHFGVTHPESVFYGIDISGEMRRITNVRVKEKNLTNVFAEEGSVEDIERLFPAKKFDLIYVFFGALNTVEDLEKAAGILKALLTSDGVMVLSFVNRYYIMGMALETLKLRFSHAFARLRRDWGGYSPVKHLPSHCYTPKEILHCFRGMELMRRRGFSILQPAWYYQGLNQRLGKLSKWLWKADILINKTFCWKFGEYTLFIFKKP